MAFGFEIPLIKQTYMGLEISYLYTNLEFENQEIPSETLPPLKQNPNQNFFMRRQFPNRPQVKDFHFEGDLVNFTLLFGVNF